MLLAAAYGMAGLGKLTGAATEMFAGWGYPAWFATLIGILELAGALGLLIPKTTRYAILGLTGIMLGRLYPPGERRGHAGPTAGHLPGRAMAGVVAAAAARERRAIRSIVLELAPPSSDNVTRVQWAYRTLLTPDNVSDTLGAVLKYQDDVTQTRRPKWGDTSDGRAPQTDG